MGLVLRWQLLFERRRLQFVQLWFCTLWAFTCGRRNTMLEHHLVIDILPPSSARRCDWLLGGEQGNLPHLETLEERARLPHTGRLLLPLSPQEGCSGWEWDSEHLRGFQVVLANQLCPQRCRSCTTSTLPTGVCTAASLWLAVCQLTPAAWEPEVSLWGCC